MQRFTNISFSPLSMHNASPIGKRSQCPLFLNHPLTAQCDAFACHNVAIMTRSHSGDGVKRPYSILFIVFEASCTSQPQRLLTGVYPHTHSRREKLDSDRHQ